MAPSETNVLADRATMTLTGGLAGLAAWLLFEIVPDHVTNPHIFATLVAAVAGFFTVLLAIAGPVSIRKAMFGAGLLSVPAALMLGWASLGFETSQAFLASGFALMAWGIILFLGTPFVAVWLWDRQYWNSYLDLFDFSWSIVVRYAAAWLFVGVFWLVVFLSDALLSLVSITWIEDLLEIDAVPQVLVGAVFGLALRVVYEMREYLSPYLLLHLLRLLLPVLLVVVVIFVLALPMSDPETLFGGLSPAGTMMAVALGAISLVSVALDKSDADAVKAVWMQAVVRALSVLLPVLAGLALYGIWLRVVQYGWTPERLAAGLAALLILAYALLYFFAALRGGAWMARIRRTNVVLAGGVLAVSVLWLSPILNAEAISARSQVARYLDGRTLAKETAIWELSHDWGRAGRQELDVLNALEGDEHADLHRAIELAANTDNRYSFETRLGNTGRDKEIQALLGLVRMVPPEATLNRAALRNLPEFRLTNWVSACQRAREPACVLVLEDFNVTTPGPEGIMILPGRNRGYDAVSVWFEDGALVTGDYLYNTSDGSALSLTRADVQRLLSGDFRVAPSSRKSLWLGDLELHPEN